MPDWGKLVQESVGLTAQDDDEFDGAPPLERGLDQLEQVNQMLANQIGTDHIKQA
jgi:hypothetical protein